MKKLKEEFESDINLSLSPYNPEFEQKFEFRDFTYPPTTTLIFKVSVVFTGIVFLSYKTLRIHFCYRLLKSVAMCRG